jgi:hypothetical protein
MGLRACLADMVLLFLGFTVKSYQYLYDNHGMTTGQETLDSNLYMVTCMWHIRLSALAAAGPHRHFDVFDNESLHGPGGNRGRGPISHIV